MVETIERVLSSQPSSSEIESVSATYLYAKAVQYEKTDLVQVVFMVLQKPEYSPFSQVLLCTGTLVLRGEGSDTVGSGHKVGAARMMYGMKRCHDSNDTAVGDSECHGGNRLKHGQASLSEFSTRTLSRVDS